MSPAFCRNDQVEERFCLNMLVEMAWSVEGVGDSTAAKGDAEQALPAFHRDE